MLDRKGDKISVIQSVDDSRSVVDFNYGDTKMSIAFLFKDSMTGAPLVFDETMRRYLTIDFIQKVNREDGSSEITWVYDA